MVKLILGITSKFAAGAVYSMQVAPALSSNGAAARHSAANAGSVTLTADARG